MFILAFPWHKFVTKTIILDLFYNIVVNFPKVECPKLSCSSFPKEKEVIIDCCKPCKPCDKECKPGEEKVCPPCNLKSHKKQCPDPQPFTLCEKYKKKEEKENFYRKNNFK